MEWNLFIIPLTIIFTELFKRSAKPDSKWIPWIAVLLGGLFGTLYGGIMDAEKAQFMAYIVQGIIYGASAAGIYDAGNAAINGNKWGGK